MCVNPFGHLKQIIVHISITDEKEQFQTIIKLNGLKRSFRGILIEKIVGFRNYIFSFKNLLENFLKTLCECVIF